MAYHGGRIGGVGRVEGDLMSYELETREGSITCGVTEFEQGIYSGGQLRKKDDSPYDINKDGTVDQLDLDILEAEMGNP